MICEFLIGGVGDVVVFGLVVDCCKVDVDKGYIVIFVIVEKYSFKNVWVEF